MEQLQCANCQRVQPPDRFDQTRKDIYRTICKPCWPARMRGERKCRRCQQYKTTETFARKPSGGRECWCPTCIANSSFQKTCVVCRITQPRDEFPRNTENRFRDKCKQCYKPLPDRVDCSRCGKNVFHLHTRVALEDASKRQCKQCFFDVNKVRKCSHCKTEKLQKEFRRTNSNTVSTRCFSCPPTQQRHSHPLRFSRDPCFTCGQRFKTANPNSRVKPPKYCSVKCRAVGQRNEVKSCVGCLRIMSSLYLYDRVDGPHCLSCKKAKDRGMIVIARTQGKAAALAATARLRARRMGKKNKIGIREVEKAMSDDCYLCGDAMDVIDFINPKGEVDADNMVSLCSFCRNLRLKKSFDEIHQWALAVVQGVPTLVVNGARKWPTARRNQSRDKPIVIDGVHKAWR